jgi:hypothetical protein
MYLNLHLEKRLADQRMHDDQCTARLEMILRGIQNGTKSRESDFVTNLVRDLLMVMIMPFQKGPQLHKRT